MFKSKSEIENLLLYFDMVFIAVPKSPFLLFVSVNFLLLYQAFPSQVLASCSLLSHLKGLKNWFLLLLFSSNLLRLFRSLVSNKKYERMTRPWFVGSVHFIVVMLVESIVFCILAYLIPPNHCPTTGYYE